MAIAAQHDPSGIINRLLTSNAQWAADVARVQPKFFDACAQGQEPKVLWIGCADSRVPESVVMACKPGDVFVTRNIANQVHLSDDSILSVLTYAVAELGVEHIVVVGHSKCGGVAACMGGGHGMSETSPLGRWLTPLANLAHELAPKEAIELVEANVRAQVQNVLQTDIIADAWSPDAATRGKSKLIGVHGWVYDIEKGRLRDLGISVYA